jgi:hypothetical protein
MIFLYGLRVFWGFVVQIDISSSQSLSFLLVGIMICFACIMVCVGVSAEQVSLGSINQWLVFT